MYAFKSVIYVLWRIAQILNKVEMTTETEFTTADFVILKVVKNEK